MTIGELLEILNDKPDEIHWDEWWSMPVMLNRGDCLEQADVDSSGVIEMEIIDENGGIDKGKDAMLAYYISINKNNVGTSLILGLTNDRLN